MRRIALISVLVLAIAACGDDDAAETTSATTADTTAATEAPAETTTTTAPAPTTTVAAGNPLVEAALEFVGQHAGEWSNTTFGSSGPIDLTVEVDEAAETALFTLDLGGFVFGVGDPDPVQYEMDLSIGAPDVDVYEFDIVDDELFGGGTLVFEGADFVFTAPVIESVGDLEMIVEGTFTDTGLEGTYTITGLAEGTIEITADAG